jgi:hypothetical protein
MKALSPLLSSPLLSSPKPIAPQAKVAPPSNADHARSGQLWIGSNEGAVDTAWFMRNCKDKLGLDRNNYEYKILRRLAYTLENLKTDSLEIYLRDPLAHLEPIREIIQSSLSRMRQQNASWRNPK